MNVPKFAIRINTYAEFERFARAFATDFLNLLIVLGSAGLSKTRTLQAAVGSNACCIEGYATPFAVYCKLYESLDKLIVLDDADSLYKKPDGLRLLKQLCQTEAAKRLAWTSANRAIKDGEIPPEFETRSKVAIVANQWCLNSADVEALEDRGHVLVFEPSALEVHQRTATWFWDQEIFDFFAEHLQLITEPSMRHYLAAWELREAGLKWEGLTRARFITGTALAVANLKADHSFKTEEDRANAFHASGAGCRATYFNHAKKLREKMLDAQIEVPRITLTHSKPPEDSKKPSRPPSPVQPNGQAATNGEAVAHDDGANGDATPNGAAAVNGGGLTSLTQKRNRNGDSLKV